MERALDANAGNQDIQRLGERIQQAAPQRECSKDKPTYWSGHIGDEGWAACPVTGETLSALRSSEGEMYMQGVGFILHLEVPL